MRHMRRFDITVSTHRPILYNSPAVSIAEIELVLTFMIQIVCLDRRLLSRVNYNSTHFFNIGSMSWMYFLSEILHLHRCPFILWANYDVITAAR